VRVLVTGSRGFAGGWLVRHLKDCGDEVVELPPGLDVRDSEALAVAVAAAAPDAVCHLAAQASVGRSWTAPEETFSVNTLGTLNLCLAAATLEQPPRVLLVSTAEVYGRVSHQRMPVREDEPFAPVNPYAASKAAAEMAGLQAWLGQGLPVVRARSFNHTGPGQAEGFVVPDLAVQVARAAKGDLDRIATGNIDVSRDMSDVRDVVRAYRELLLKGEPGEAYNVCRGEAVAISFVLRRLMELAGVDVPVEADPARYRHTDVPVHVGDPGRLVARTGWRPEIPLEQTLADVLSELGVLRPL
jgi:GDP-4-dehydro-6-deoxy-D-mannose reductase